MAAVKTYRYLRLAMVALVVGLGAAVLYEHFKTRGDCWQESISAYYYTPAQGFLVGALVTIGVCLVSLRGNSDWEDVLLNLAGVCAPVVALVPSPDPGTCGSVLTDTTNRNLNIGNNVVALLTAGLAGLLAVGILSWLSIHNKRADRPGTTAVRGFAVITALFAGTVVVFFGFRTWFIDHGHPIAAITMFVFIWLNVLVNARNLYLASKKDHPQKVSAWNRYTVVGVVMAVAAIANVIAGALGFRYATLTIEASLIVLFAWFWVAQTAELWNQGLRDDVHPARPYRRV